MATVPVPSTAGRHWDVSQVNYFYSLGLEPEAFVGNSREMKAAAGAGRVGRGEGRRGNEQRGNSSGIQGALLPLLQFTHKMMLSKKVNFEALADLSALMRLVTQILPLNAAGTRHRNQGNEEDVKAKNWVKNI